MIKYQTRSRTKPASFDILLVHVKQNPTQFRSSHSDCQFTSKLNK